MSDNFVTVAKFQRTFEAQSAKNLLENEGIESTIGGAISSDMLFGSLALGDQIVLQVREEDAQRAAGVLASAAAEAQLDDDWEEKAESGVWICSICGEPISNRLSICHSCRTPIEGIRAEAPSDPRAIRADRVSVTTGHTISKREESVPSAVEKNAPSSEREEPDDDRELPTSIGDALCRKAFLSTVFGIMFPILLPIAWVLLFRAAMIPTDETSAKGTRYFYAGLAVNFSIVCALCLFFLYIG